MKEVGTIIIPMLRMRKLAHNVISSKWGGMRAVAEPGSSSLSLLEEPTPPFALLLAEHNSFRL